VARGFVVLEAGTGAPLQSWHPSLRQAEVLSVARSGARVLVAGYKLAP
jgi:hypothetical protein